MRNPFSQQTIQKLKFAFTAAKERMGGNGQRLSLSAALVVLGFVLMALFAPIAYRLPGIFQTIFSIIPFFVLIFGVWLAIKLLLDISKEENTNQIPEKQTRGTIAKAAIMAAFDEIENVSLIQKDMREYEDCISGKFLDCPIVLLQSSPYKYCVIRVKEPFKTMVLFNARGRFWVYGLPTDKKLVPVTLPPEMGCEAWSFNNLTSRDHAQILADKLMPALKTAAIGGEIPFIVAKDRNLIMAWENADLGSCSLIAYEFIKALKV